MKAINRLLGENQVYLTVSVRVRERKAKHPPLIESIKSMLCNVLPEHVKAESPNSWLRGFVQRILTFKADTRFVSD